LRDNILGSTLRPSSLLYDFIDLRSSHDPAGFIGHQLPVRRDAALPGSGSSKKNGRTELGQAIKNPAGEDGA
jgi:hypothetical protein